MGFRGEKFEKKNRRSTSWYRAIKPEAKRTELKDELGDRVTVMVIPNASHALIPEQPEAVVAALTTWIKRLP